MANQSIVSIPPDVEDPTVLRRVLGKIVEALDVVVGTREAANLQYVSQAEVTAAISKLQRATAKVEVAVEKEKKALTLNQQTLQEAVQQLSVNKQEIADLDSRVTLLEGLPLATERMKWLGAWSTGSYAKNDVVKHSGASWVALTATTGEPGISTDWESMV